MERRELKVGDRVHLSELGRKRARISDKRGIIAGVPKSVTQYRVQWDGLRLPQLIHRTYLEREPALESSSRPESSASTSSSVEYGARLARAAPSTPKARTRG